MPSLKQLRDDLGFVHECQTLFGAMQHTALAQLGRILQAHRSKRPVGPILEQWCLPMVPEAAFRHPLLRAPTAVGEGSLIVLMTGDQGLVGPLYHEVIRLALAQACEPSHWIALGVRGSTLLTERDVPHQTIPSPVEEDVPPLMRRLATQLIQQIRQTPVSRVWLVSSRFDSMTRHIATAQPLLPWPSRSAAAPEDVVSEPSLERAVEQLVWTWLRIRLEDAWWTNRLAELAARALHLEEARDDLTAQSTALRRELCKAMHQRLDTMAREMGAAHPCR